MKCHRHLPTFEWHWSARVVPYLCFDAAEFATQHGNVLDVVETGRHHLPVSSCYRHYFVEAVQSCRRRCAVQRCSNRRIAIRNHASNRRRRRLVQTFERADDVRLVVLSPDQAPNPSMSGRSPYNVNFVLLFTSAMNFCVTGS